MNISYDESLRLKGVAILMMVWLHCFINWNNPEYAYTNILYLLGEPLVYRTTYIATIVVPLYCFLSGYGLAKKYPFGMAYVFRKLRILYLQHWFVLTAFLIMGYLMKSPDIAFSWNFFFANYLGFDTTFNATLWFLLPYAMLLGSSSFLFSTLDKYKRVLIPILLIFILFLFSSYLLKKEADGRIGMDVVSLLFCNYFKLLFPFILGYFATKVSLSDKWRKKISENRRVVIILLLSFIFTKLFIPSYSLSYLFLIPFIAMLHILKYPGIINHVLMFLGRLSTFIWFIHAYFTFYIFHTYIYSLSYCLLIFLSVVVFSVFSSYLFKKIYAFLLSCNVKNDYL